MSEMHVKQAQVLLQVNPDGDFGPKSLAALQRMVAQLDRCKELAEAESDEAEAVTVPTGSQELAAVNPTGFRLGRGSLQKLEGIHPDLVKVVKRLEQITTMPFMVVDGVRSRVEQEKMVAKGASKTLNSRHLTGHAVDMVPLTDDGKPSWSWTLIRSFVPFVKQAAKDAGVKVEYGADWLNFPDGAHYQLPRSTHP